MKVVINACAGGFSISEKAINRLAELGYICEHEYDFRVAGHRSDPLLIQVVEELGKEANGRCADLMIVEIPDDAEWHIEDDCGWERVAEDHRTWP